MTQGDVAHRQAQRPQEFRSVYKTEQIVRMSNMGHEILISSRPGFLYTLPLVTPLGMWLGMTLLRVHPEERDKRTHGSRAFKD